MFTLLVLIAAAPTKVLLAILKDPIVWVTALTTLAIPLLTAASTRPTTSGLVKAFVSFILAGIYALVTWLGALNGDVDWKAALAVFAVAAAGAGGINSAWISGQIATWLGIKVPINVGPKPMTPEKAAAIHSNKSGDTESVPGDSTSVVLFGDFPKMDSDVLALEQDPSSLAAIKAQLDAS